MFVHLGKKMMLNTDWYGAWDSKKNSEASKFADNYYELRERAVEHLSDQYKDIIKKVKEGRAVYVVSPETRPITPRASFPARVTPTSASPATPTPSASRTGSDTVDRYLRFWASRSHPGRNMTIRKRRMRTIMSWSREDVEKFIRHAPLTIKTRRALRTALAGRTT